MSPTRRELVRATRARIVDAAGRLTRERGPNGFSMDVLAKVFYALSIMHVIAALPDVGICSPIFGHEEGPRLVVLGDTQ